MNPYSIASTRLGMSSMQRGIDGMISPVRPGPNAYDQGGASKPSVNTQPFNNQRLAEQNTLQNTFAAAPQAAANAMGQVRSQTAQEADAQQFLLSRNAEAIYANLEAESPGSAMMRLNAVMQSPEKFKFLHGVAIGKAMTAGMSSDLAGEITTKNQYI